MKSPHSETIRKLVMEGTPLTEISKKLEIPYQRLCYQVRKMDLSIHRRKMRGAPDYEKFDICVKLIQDGKTWDEIKTEYFIDRNMFLAAYRTVHKENLSADDIDDIMRQYNDGVSVRELAMKYYYQYNSMYQLIRRRRRKQ